MRSTFGFVNCVGMADRTLLPLEFKPAHCGEDYYSRKGGYAVNALNVCDDVARIRSLTVRWPESCHDNRVWPNTPLARDPNAYFDSNQYILGDSAFQTSNTMIPASKKPLKAKLDASKRYFTKLARVRIKTEHSIGLLKARFQYLKRIRVLLSVKRGSMRRLIRLVTCACILHNLLTSEQVPGEWQVREREPQPDSIDNDDELIVAVSRDATAGERRNQLLCYLLETRG